MVADSSAECIISIKNQSPCFWRDHHGDEVDLLLDQGTTLDHFESKAVKLSWPKLQGNGKIRSPFLRFLCLKRISEYREFDPKKDPMEGNYMEDFAWFRSDFHFLQKSNHPRGPPVILELTSQVKMEGIHSQFCSWKVVFPKDLFIREMN